MFQKTPEMSLLRAKIKYCQSVFNFKVWRARASPPKARSKNHSFSIKIIDFGPKLMLLDLAGPTLRDLQFALFTNFGGDNFRVGWDRAMPKTPEMSLLGSGLKFCQTVFNFMA